MLRLVPLILAALPAQALAQEAPAGPVLQRDVNAAIDRGVQWLLGAQGPDGTWLTARPGRTALNLYALLKSGQDPESEPVRRALYSLGMQDVQQTYDAAILIQVLQTLDQPEYQEWIEVLAERLQSWQRDTGDWSYPGGEGDLSNTQYAALGLWTAAQAGVETPVDTWKGLYDGVQRYASRQGGFGYSRGARGVGESMTAAGIATLQICAVGLGRAGQLSTSASRQIERAHERSLEWLGRHFEDAVSATQGGWPYYRLYAIERVGALLGLQLIAERDWYEEGAANILAAQNEDGSWGNLPAGMDRPDGRRRRGDGWVDVRTAFALLFLKRATSFTGTGGSSSQRTVFGTDSSEADVQVRATGSDPLTIWITGWGPSTRGRFEWPREAGDGPHVSRVEYLVDGRVAAVVEGDPSQAAGVERFEIQHTLPRSGAYEVQVRVTVHNPPSKGRDEPGPPFALSSPPFRVEVTGVVPAWLRAQSGDRRRNLMPAGAPRVRATTGLRQDGRDHAPERAIDNFTLTAWLARPEDEEPRLTITLEHPQTADLILLASPRTVPHLQGFYARPMEVEVLINEEQSHRVLMPPDERRKARLELEDPVRIKRLDLTIRHSAPGQTDATGLAEVELQRR